MVRLTEVDERVFLELRDLLGDIHALLSPVTERFATLEVTLRELQVRIAHYAPTVCLTVVGHSLLPQTSTTPAIASGKSHLLNAIIGQELLPQYTEKPLQICPFDGSTAMLRRAAGKAIAVGVENILQHLESEKEVWIEELSDRRLHTKLPLIIGTHCYAANWELLDTPQGTTAICPSVSSVASRIHTPNIFSGDVIFYCMNSTAFGLPSDEHVLDQLVGDLKDVPEATLERLLGQTYFILTHYDAVSDEEDNLTRILKYTKPMMTSTEDLLHRFFAIFQKRFPGLTVPPKERVILVSSRNSLLSKKMLAADPSMADIYNYCEMMYGAEFMQKIDNMEEQELRRLVQHHAQNQGALKSGSAKLDELLCLFDFNASRHLMWSIAVTGAESVMQLLTALKKAVPTVQVEIQENTEDLSSLVTEMEWIVASAQKIDHFIASLTDRIVELIDSELKGFLKRRVEELQYVLEHRELAWFRERQASTVVQMNSSLKKVEAFTEKYMKHRQFLEEKQNSGDSCTWDFIEKNLNGILSQLEKEKQEHLTNFGLQFAHHVKDEYVVFVPELMEKIAEKKVQLLEELKSLSLFPLEQTQSRLQLTFDIDQVILPLLDVLVVEANERRVNNFFRDLPEHIAVAAVELSNEWYNDMCLESAASSSVPVTGRSGISDGEGGNVMVNTTSSQQGGNIKRALAYDDLAGKEGFTIKPELRYIHEAWRLGASTIKIHQLSTYRFHDLTEIIQNMNDHFLTFIGKYAKNLEEAVREQKQLIATAIEEEEIVEQKYELAFPYVEKFEAMLGRIQGLMVNDLDKARHMAKEEEDRLAAVSS